MQATARLMTLRCLSYVMLSMPRDLNSVVSKLHNLQNLTQTKKKRDLSPRNFVYLADLQFPVFSSIEFTWLIPE